MNCKIGYARVSTLEQSTEAQEHALRRAGCHTVFSENVSGAKKDRPRLREAISSAHPGDQFIVVKIDRLARSLTDLLDIVSQLRSRGAHFVSLTDPIDTSSAQGTLMMQILGSFAEFERALVSERTKLGLRRAREKGRVGGNPKLKSKVPAAIAQASAQRDKNYFAELSSTAHIWVPIVKRYRPKHSWRVVAGVVNGAQDQKCWSSEALRRAAKCFVRNGLIDSSLMQRSERVSQMSDRVNLFIAGLVYAKPSLTLAEIVKKLDASRFTPPRGLSGWSESSVRAAILKALELGLITNWKG